MSQLTPGQRIGIGRTAEVFAWGDGRVIKVLRPGFPEAAGEREVAIAAFLNEAGLAAPRFFGTERVDGRLGLVYERLEGPSMLDRLTARPWLVDRIAARFAVLQAEIHGTQGAGLPNLVVAIRGEIDMATPELGPTRRHAALARLDRLTPGSVVCHGDMHPGNVILADRGPVVIDWPTARSGPAEADLARTLYLLTNAAVPVELPRLQRALIDAVRRRFAGTYLRLYRRARRVDDEQLALWRLPVLAARLAEDIDAERDDLLALFDIELAGAT